MAPDARPSGPAVDSNDVLVYRVPGNVYLYYLKIFAHAVVRRYKNDVAIWKLEGELNAARLNEMANIQWGRHGNLWEEEAAGGFQDKVWRILVNAVRQDDPTARTFTGLHMLNLVKGIERFGPDLDIVGVNPYPHDFFAAPVIGFAAGEFVWATRRALIGLGLSGKDVYVSETTYPGKVNDPGEEPPTGTSVDANLRWFSDGRQRKFMVDAIQTSFSNGARGFFWWTFLDREDSSHAFLPHTTFGSLIRKSTGEFKTATTALQSQSAAKHPGKSQILLANKNISTGADIAGTLSLLGQRDAVPSGTPTIPVYALKQRSHVSQTDQQFLASLKHQLWDNNAQQFHLKESFIPSQDVTPRNAFFGGTNPIQLRSDYIDGSTPVTMTGATINLRDPWRVDQVGNQNNAYGPITVSTNESVFLDQSIPNGTYYSIRALTVSTYNGLVLAFTNWTSNGTTVTTSSNYETSVVFNAANGWAKANYVVTKPSRPPNVLVGGNPGSNPVITWNIHPSTNVTQYQIWRQTRKYPTPVLLATVARTTTSYIDAGKIITAGYTDDILYYDVRSYYAPNGTYSDPYWIGGVFGGTGGIQVGARGEEDKLSIRVLPTSYSVSAFPNPFNPSTTIAYELPEETDVSLIIYDLMGRRISELVSSQHKAGVYRIQWNGRGDEGQKVASGIYLYRFLGKPIGDKEIIKILGKLIMLK